MLFYDVHSSLYYWHKQHEEGVTIIESSSSMRQSDPLGYLLFSLTHYWAFLKTIAQALDYVFPSPTNDTHIMGPMNKIIHALAHLLTQLTLIGFKVKVSKCKLWTPLKIPSSKEIP
jgi:hypothetical protein